MQRGALEAVGQQGTVLRQAPARTSLCSSSSSGGGGRSNSSIQSGPAAGQALLACRGLKLLFACRHKVAMPHNRSARGVSRHALAAAGARRQQHNITHDAPFANRAGRRVVSLSLLSWQQAPPASCTRRSQSCDSATHLQLATMPRTCGTCCTARQSCRRTGWHLPHAPHGGCAGLQQRGVAQRLMGSNRGSERHVVAAAAAAASGKNNHAADTLSSTSSCPPLLRTRQRRLLVVVRGPHDRRMHLLHRQVVHHLPRCRGCRANGRGALRAVWPSFWLPHCSGAAVRKGKQRQQRRIVGRLAHHAQLTLEVQRLAGGHRLPLDQLQPCCLHIWCRADADRQQLDGLLLARGRGALFAAAWRREAAAAAAVREGCTAARRATAGCSASSRYQQQAAAAPAEAAPLPQRGRSSSPVPRRAHLP